VIKNGRAARPQKPPKGCAPETQMQCECTISAQRRQAAFVQIPRDFLRGDPAQVLVIAGLRSFIPKGGVVCISVRRLALRVGLDRRTVARILRALDVPGIRVQANGRTFVVEARWPEGPWARAPRVLLADKRLPPALKVVVLALWNRPGTANELAERFGLSPRHIWRLLKLLKAAGFCRAGVERRENTAWTLTPEAYEALMRNPTAFIRPLVHLCHSDGTSMSVKGGREDGPECRSGLDESAVGCGASLEREKERDLSKDAAEAASPVSLAQLEAERNLLSQQLAQAKEPAGEPVRRRLLAVCRVQGGHALAVALWREWERVRPNVAEAERLEELLRARLPSMAREVGRKEGRVRYVVAQRLMGDLVDEAREDARTEIEGLRVRLERVVWELEAQTEAARVRVSGAAGWCEEAEGRRVLTVTERVEVEARAAWAPPGREPVDVECRAAFWEARRELILARLPAGEASPPARVPEESRPTAARGEEAVPEDWLEASVRSLFEMRMQILNPPTLPTGGLG